MDHFMILLAWCFHVLFKAWKTKSPFFVTACEKSNQFILWSTEESQLYRFGFTRGWVNNDRIPVNPDALIFTNTPFQNKPVFAERIPNARHLYLLLKADIAHVFRREHRCVMLFFSLQQFFCFEKFKSQFFRNVPLYNIMGFFKHSFMFY